MVFLLTARYVQVFGGHASGMKTAVALSALGNMIAVGYTTSKGIPLFYCLQDNGAHQSTISEASYRPATYYSFLSLLWNDGQAVRHTRRSISLTLDFLDDIYYHSTKN
jgi:hypothetical protein